MTADEQRAVAEYDCPFCGAEAGQACRRVEATYSPMLPVLVSPHLSRTGLLYEPDPAVRGSMRRKQ